MKKLLRIIKRKLSEKNWTVFAKCYGGHWVYIGDHCFKFMAIRHAKWALVNSTFTGVEVESLWSGSVVWDAGVRK